MTFLFTDIEGSTALWERSPDAMRDALADHDGILRATVAAHGGAVFKTFGDAFCCAFAGPRDAVDAAIEVQRTLASHIWPSDVGEIRVRMGIHTGNAVERDGDYFGPTVNRVARLMSMGSGRQILVSSAAATLLRGTLPDGARLRDLGAHRMRDLSQAEMTYQLDADGLPADFPALASLDARPNNLPSQISSFVGREKDIEELREFLTGHRLVTVTGAGGMGKTRVALQVAGAAIRQFRDGAWFVELSSIGEAALVAQTIASAVNVRETPLETIEQTLLRELARKNVLLVVDNAEHLLESVAGVVKSILTRCTEVSVLVTSREPLHITGELVYRLGTLPEAPRLFIERARAIAPALAIGDDGAVEISSLCRKLEGIPLAIELAAARVSTLSLRQLNERLSEPLALLATKDRTQGRHRTLHATIDWSYQLLNDEERRVFAALSVFLNGFTLDACERVVPVTAVPLLDVLESLTEKSFLQADLREKETRFKPLDVMREFGRSALSASAAAETERKHAEYYAEFAARRHQVTPDATAEWHTRLDDETFNLRAALDWCVKNDHARGARLALDLAPYWRIRSNITEARNRISTLRAFDELEPQLRASLLCTAASFAAMQDDFTESLALANEALELSRGSGDSGGTADALFRIAEVEHRKGRLPQAKELYEDARSLYVESRNARGEMLCNANLGMLARQQGDYASAKALLEDALARANASGERRIIGDFVIALAWINLYLEDLALSNRLFEEALAEKDAERDRYGICSARHGLATVALKNGRLDRAFDEFMATVDAALDLQLHDYLFRGFDGISAVLALRGDAESAARYLGLAERLFRESGRELRDSIAFDIASAEIASALEPAQREALLSDGERMRADEGVAALRSGEV